MNITWESSNLHAYTSLTSKEASKAFCIISTKGYGLFTLRKCAQVQPMLEMTWAHYMVDTELCINHTLVPGIHVSQIITKT